jgi:hypothetical protein
LEALKRALGLPIPSMILGSRSAGTDPDEPFVLRRLPHADALMHSDCFRSWTDGLDCAVVDRDE